MIRSLVVTTCRMFPPTSTSFVGIIIRHHRRNLAVINIIIIRLPIQMGIRIIKTNSQNLGKFHTFTYICNSQKYFVWLSVYYMKLAWEWATDKKNANCLESLYSSCCQITLYLSAKIMFFLWIPEFSGYNLHGDFKNNPNQEWHLYRSRVHVTHRQR